MNNYLSPIIPATHRSNAPNITAVAPADIALSNAIKYANKKELPVLIDRAMAVGSALNHADCYDCNALVIAVRANRPQAISILMARGAQIPPVPADGVTLLMEACRDDNADMVLALVDVAKMDVNQRDTNEKSALHYAAIANSEEVCTILLRARADVNAETSKLTEREIISLFGNDHPVAGMNITPLMIAIGHSNEALTEILLAAGADPDLGAASPLIIAASNNDDAIFGCLIKEGADLKSCNYLNRWTGLAACVVARMPVEYLSKLITQHDFRHDRGTVQSPLGLAIEAKLDSVVALFMACRAPVDPHAESDEPITLWEHALPNGIFCTTASDLLTASRPARISVGDMLEFDRFMSELIDNCDKPFSLASEGVFTYLIVRASEPLRKLRERASQIHPSQLLLEANSIIAKSLPIIHVPQVADTNNATAPHEFWCKTMEERRGTQRTELFQATTIRISEFMGLLKESTTLEFFLETARDCPDDQSINGFIKKCIQKSGAPDTIVRLIKNAWINAAKWTKDWQVAPDVDESANRFLLALAHNLMRKALDDFHEPHDPVVDTCLSALREALPLNSHTLSQFSSNPVIWLRKFENRKNLDDPSEGLAIDLQIELGLSLETCGAIVAVWRNAIRTARTARWNSSEELQSVLKHQVALGMSDALLTGPSNQIVPASTNLVLQNWRSKVLSTRVVAVPSRKRPAEAAAPGAPAYKKAKPTERN